MDFFIDFEATQFSDRIISIGCVAGDGREFYTLSRPKDPKINKFVTELTGITTEMVKEAPSIEDAFVMFKTYMAQFEPAAHKYYFFGDSDAQFLSRSMREIKTMEMLEFMGNLKRLGTDAYKWVQRELGATAGLNKLYCAIFEENHMQNHNALDDAKMLKEIVMWVQQATCEQKQDVIARLKYIAENSIVIKKEEPERAPAKKAPEIFISWNGCTKENAPTGATADNYNIRAYSTGSKKSFYFPNMETAVLWSCKFITRGSPKKDDHLSKLRKGITKAISSNTTYQGFLWCKKS